MKVPGRPAKPAESFPQIAVVEADLHVRGASEIVHVPRCRLPRLITVIRLITLTRTIPVALLSCDCFRVFVGGLCGNMGSL